MKINTIYKFDQYKLVEGLLKKGTLKIPIGMREFKDIIKTVVLHFVEVSLTDEDIEFEYCPSYSGIFLVNTIIKKKNLKDFELFKLKKENYHIEEKGNIENTNKVLNYLFGKYTTFLYSTQEDMKNKKEFDFYIEINQDILNPANKSYLSSMTILDQMCKPIWEYIKTKYNVHHSIIIDQHRIKLVDDHIAMPNESNNSNKEE